jgi:hypothetical protein
MAQPISLSAAMGCCTGAGELEDVAPGSGVGGREILKLPLTDADISSAAASPAFAGAGLARAPPRQPW